FDLTELFTSAIIMTRDPAHQSNSSKAQNPKASTDHFGCWLSIGLMPIWVLTQNIPKFRY
ncbi:hypothetical protein, partial [Varibaculum cambriense]|uniref:hypothetical protein n=1 Tax=Varibaculum cambriense TaxID=184870 RepID=UPI00242D339E